MPTAKKQTSISRRFSPAEVSAAKAAAPARSASKSEVDWSQGTVTPGGGVGATVAALHRTRGPNKRPAKEQVAIRLDQEVVGALRASGPGWQTRVNAALKEWLATQPVKRKTRGHSAV
ncbi:MAG: BrnA antitoxin family protein [Rubrivivax sp.]|nr:BrnA antitoxin family protein [Rubrivivax sp.]